MFGKVFRDDRVERVKDYNICGLMLDIWMNGYYGYLLMLRIIDVKIGRYRLVVEMGNLKKKLVEFLDF